MMCDCRSYWPPGGGLVSQPPAQSSLHTSPAAFSSYYGQQQQQLQQQPQLQQSQLQPTYPLQQSQQPGISCPQPQLQAQLDLRAYYCYEYANYTPTSSSRQMRNQAEKQRRDKLNTFISELALLVPMVSSSAKKLDKTSILRLSATFLRMNQVLMSEQKGQVPKSLSARMCQFLKSLFDGTDGMLMVVTSTGKIVFISENVEQYLGHHQNDLMGTKLSDITHQEDLGELNFNLKPRDDEDLLKPEGSSGGWSSSRHSERRSFFLRLRLKSASKNDQQPQYELVHVEGHLRVPKPTHHSHGKTKTHAFDRYLKAHLSVNNGYDGKGELTTAGDTILIGVVKPYKERRVMDNSLLEAYKEEWFTRHLLDGTIVFSDHRISVLSGYMSVEVSGDSAFKFMHKDDVRWVMISLRQMFCTGASYAWSAYRLLMKNGDYIYLRTQGYLEKDDSSPVAKSFICVNTLLAPHEGEALITEMKRTFTPLVQKSMIPLASPTSSMCSSPLSSGSGADSPSSDVVELPPLRTNDNRELKMAIDLLLSDLSQPVAGEPPPPHQRDSDYAKVEMVSKALPPIEIQSRKLGAKLPRFGGKYSRPSVITSTITGSAERQKRPQENVEVLSDGETKRLRSDSSTKSVIESTTGAAGGGGGAGVIRRSGGGGGGREEDEEGEETGGGGGGSEAGGLPYELDSTLLLTSTELILSAASSTTTPYSQVSDEDSLRLPDEGSSSELWDSSVSDLDEGVLSGHLHLEDRIQSQGVQLEEIEEELETVPLSGSNVYRNHITDLKAEHRKQQEMLKNLQHDHQHIHQVKGQLTLRTSQQDIGA